METESEAPVLWAMTNMDETGLDRYEKDHIKVNFPKSVSYVSVSSLVDT
jgi:hypothetical protein